MTDSCSIPAVRSKTAGLWQTYEKPNEDNFFVWPFGCVTKPYVGVSTTLMLRVMQWCAEAYGGEMRDRLPIIDNGDNDIDRQPIFGCNEARYALRMNFSGIRADFASEEDRMLFLLKWSDLE